MDAVLLITALVGDRDGYQMVQSTCAGEETKWLAPILWDLDEMPERLRRDRRLSAEETELLRAARAEFEGRPSMSELLASDEYAGPMSVEEYLEWRRGSGDMPLARQLKAAIAATGQSLYSIAQASGVAAPVLQRFVNGQRGITLETAGKVAAYLGLSLLPETRK
jgi:hypothetical protein